MDLGEILRVMLRRWYIMVPMLLLAGVVAWVAAVVVPTQYESASTVSLLSADVSNEDERNPFLNFDASLVAMADYLGRSLQSTEANKELQTLGVTESYTVGLATGAQGPFLTFTVTGTDEAHVLRSAATLTKFAEERLERIQHDYGVASKDMIRMNAIVPPQKPVAKMKKKIEGVLVGGGGTTVTALLLTFVAEGVSRSRARRRGGAAVAVAGGGWPGQPDSSRPRRQLLSRQLPGDRSPAPGDPPVPDGSAGSGDLLAPGERPVSPVPVSPVSPAALPQPPATRLQVMSSEAEMDQTVVLDLPGRLGFSGLGSYGSYDGPASKSTPSMNTPNGASDDSFTAGSGTSSTTLYRSSGATDATEPIGQDDADSAHGR